MYRKAPREATPKVGRLVNGHIADAALGKPPLRGCQRAHVIVQAATSCICSRDCLTTDASLDTAVRVEVKAYHGTLALNRSWPLNPGGDSPRCFVCSLQNGKHGHDDEKRPDSGEGGPPALRHKHRGAVLP